VDDSRITEKGPSAKKADREADKERLAELAGFRDTETRAERETREIEGVIASQKDKHPEITLGGLIPEERLERRGRATTRAAAEEENTDDLLERKRPDIEELAERARRRDQQRRTNGPPPPPGQPTPLDELLTVFKNWLYLPDTGIVTVTMAAVAANLADGDPVWPLLIGPPSSGKTEVLDSLLDLPHVYSAGVLTEAALLSGVAKRERTSDASGGLLRAMGAFGFIIAKDFTSVLSMPRESRTPLLAALREVHDGAWTRHVGTDGGRSISWQGKCALLGGCTPVIDQHHAVTAAMGERFLLYRIPEVEPVKQAREALKHVGHENEMRRALRAAVKQFFTGFAPPAWSLEDSISLRLSNLAALAAKCRSAVERDNYRREIDLIPDSERPARLVIALSRLYNAMLALGVKEAERWRLVFKIAFDSMPALRQRIFHYLHKQDVPMSTNDVSVGIQHPANTTRRALEDLEAHGIVTRSKGKNNSDIWYLSGLSKVLLDKSSSACEKEEKA
jgi:hypothetical protein